MSEGAARWLDTGAETYERVNALVTAPLTTRKSWRNWWIATIVAFLFTIMFVVSMGLVFGVGIGVLGNNTTDVWGTPLANYVWWIGIGNAGTLISAMLLITRQHWRSSINRSAETMTLMAVSIAGLFPIIHLGRPLYFLWLLPYPNSMNLWPQWRSALVWDFWAIACYLLFSIVFWYVGTIPDLAMMRDIARSRFARYLYGAFALGWRNSARDWQVHQRFYYTMAGLAVPLVCSVHSIVGLDFAASLMPGWAEGIFPPYFVVGAMFSGFAMVTVLLAAIRWGFGFQAIITKDHFDMIARMMLLGALILGMTYLIEWFSAWYGGDDTERRYTYFVLTGSYAPIYWAMFFFNVVISQVFWFRPARRNIALAVIISILVNVGMWLERILIVWTTLSHSYSPGMWALFLPTVIDWTLLFGSLGFFAFMYLLYVRIVPVSSIYEMRQLVHLHKREMAE